MKTEAFDLTPALSPELIERARAGNREALADLYEATNVEVYRTVHALLRDEELSKDVQQDVYLQAFSRLEQLRDPEAFLPWLRSIAVNEARGQLRRKRPLLFSELSDEADAEDPELPDVRPQASPELSLERQENARLVREILDGLSDGQRLLLGMYYYEEIPIRQIAADTGLSEGTVKAQLFRGRKRVEAAVKELEKKGVRLCGLAPLPFLLALLKRQTPAEEAGKAALEGVLAKTGAAPAAEAAALHVGRRFFQTAAGRILLGLMVAGTVGGGVAGYKWYKANLDKPMGDYQPPATVEWDLDSDEDLTLETQDETAAPETVPDTPEDLTEPETTEPTEPETTEPVGADDPIGPSEPTEPPAEPTAPSEVPSQPADPTTEMETETDEPTDPEATETQLPFPIKMRLVDGISVGGKDASELTIKVGEYERLDIRTYGDPSAVPNVYTDRPDIIQFEYSGKYSDDPSTPVNHEYYWYFTAIGSGTATIYCKLDNQMALTITVVPES